MAGILMIFQKEIFKVLFYLTPEIFMKLLLIQPKKLSVEVYETAK